MDEDETISEQLANASGQPSKRQLAVQLGLPVHSREVELAHKRFLEGLGAGFAGDGKPAASIAAPDGRPKTRVDGRRSNGQNMAIELQQATEYWRAVSATQTRDASRRPRPELLPDGTYYSFRNDSFSITDLQSFLGAKRSTLIRYIRALGIKMPKSKHFALTRYQAKVLIGFHRSMTHR